MEFHFPQPGLRDGQDDHAYSRNMIIKEIQSKTILSVSKVYPYVINPYTGCQHACSYCYAHFMKRFTGHREPWGQFVDVKVNAPDLLRQEITRKKTDRGSALPLNFRLPKSSNSNASPVR